MSGRNSVLDQEVQAPSLSDRFKNMIIRFDDAHILKTTFYVMLFGVLATLGVDYYQLAQEDEYDYQTNPIEEPILPSYLPQSLPKPEGEELTTPRPIPEITSDQELLQTPMTVELVQDGVLKLSGTITPDTAALFIEKTKNMQEYIKRIELNSPGGFVQSALDISTLIRENGWTTVVLEGQLCASSCPLIFAGGKKRIAQKGAVIGVHQFYTPGRDDRKQSQVVFDTQRTTAKITRHLEAMGIDPLLWVYALETPPQHLFYLTQEELKKFKLATK